VAPIRWPPVLLLLRSAAGGCSGGESGYGVGDSASSSFGVALWRIKGEVGRSGVPVGALDFVRFFFCPSLVFVFASGVSSGILGRYVSLCYRGSSVRRRRGGEFDVMFCVDSTDISGGFPDIASGGNIRSCFLLISVGAGGRFVRYINQLAQIPGWALVPTSTGGSAPLRGFIPLWVVPSSGTSELLVILDAPDLWPSGDAMASGHLLPGRSAVLRHVDVFNMLLMVALENCVVSWSERGSASGSSWLRSPVSRTTGRFLEGQSCNFLFIQECLCKIWNVNFEDYICNRNPVSQKKHARSELPFIIIKSS
jgi:hypothetical protein